MSVLLPVCGDGGEAAPADRARAAAPGAFAHPAFAPCACWWVPRRGAVPPAPVEFDGWARAANLTLPGGQPVSFRLARSATTPALAYERRIATTGEVATRPGNLHDACNALAWLAFPRTKAALPADPALVVPVLDAAAAAAIDAGRLAFAPEDLLALPIAALPGWDMEASGARLFDDTAVFRPRMLR